MCDRHAGHGPQLACRVGAAAWHLGGREDQSPRAASRPTVDTSFSHAEVNLETAFVSLWEAEELGLSPGDCCFLMSYLDFGDSATGPVAVWPAEFARLAGSAEVLLDLAGVEP
jgi:hypothetical protein